MIVLDAGPMIAYLAGEPGGDLVREHLEDADVPIYAHAINLCEVFYHYSRRAHMLTARAALETLTTDGVQTRSDLDTAFWEDATQIKADRQRMGLADCFGVALARRLGAELATIDYHELGLVAAGGICQVTFIR
jgi:predicted nucleic acid-binding protein